MTKTSIDLLQEVKRERKRDSFEYYMYIGYLLSKVKKER